MSTPPTWLPALPRVYFSPRTRPAHYLLRRISLLTSKISCKLALHQVQSSPAPPPTVFQPTQCYFASVSSQAVDERCCFPQRKYHCMKTNKHEEQDGLVSLKIGCNLFEVWVIMATSVVVSENTRCLSLNFHSLLSNSKLN